MVELPLPQPIVDHIQSVVRREYEYSDDRLHVTELCGCLRKTYFRRRQPIEKSPEQQWYLYRGLIFDELWTSLFPRSQLRVTHRVKNGPTIVGRIDFVYNGKLYELKTINTVKYLDSPYPHHIKQVRFYAFCENLKQAVLLYLAFDGHKVFEVDCADEEVLPVVEEIEKKALILYEALKRNTPPEPYNETWECRYCEFSTVCGGDR